MVHGMMHPHDLCDFLRIKLGVPIPIRCRLGRPIPISTNQLEPKMVWTSLDGQIQSNVDCIDCSNNSNDNKLQRSKCERTARNHCPELLTADCSRSFSTLSQLHDRSSPFCASTALSLCRLLVSVSPRSCGTLFLWIAPTAEDSSRPASAHWVASSRPQGKLSLSIASPRFGRAGPHNLHA